MEPLGARDPRQVGVYRLHARLGAGGMGRVFLGYSPAGRAVAVKVIHPELAAEPAFLTRFRREVAAARAVSGAYTAPVVAAGLDDDPPWMATTFVVGPSLAEAVAEAGPLPELWVWRLAAGLTEALQDVHACGLVHRDLTPRNVLLAADGPRVIDFGISRALEGTVLTATGLAVGTPSYMSPEQADGARVGPASDVFSLGCVIAFAATGKPPFGEGRPAPVLYRVVHADAALSGVPTGLRELVAACLAKQPNARPSLPALAQAIVAGTPPHIGTPLPQSFWPEAVARLIRPQEERAGSVPVAPVSPPQPLGPEPALDSQAPQHGPPRQERGEPESESRPGEARPESGPPQREPPVRDTESGQPQEPEPVLSGALALAEGGTLVSLPGGGTGRNGGGPGQDGPGQDGPGAARRQPAVATGPSAEALPGAAAGLALEPVQRERAASGRPAVFRVTRRRVLAGLTGASAVALAVAGWELSQPGTPQRHISKVPSHPANGRKSPQPRPSSVRSTQPGATVWRSGIGGGGYWVALAADVAYVIGWDNRAYALSVNDGRLLWSANIANVSENVGAFAVAGGVVYLAPNGTTLAALSAANGATQWTVDVNDASGILYNPLVVGDVIYLGSAGYTVWALRTSDGKTIWSTDTGGGIFAGLAAADGKLFVATMDGMLYALSAADGSTLWQVGANGRDAVDRQNRGRVRFQRKSVCCRQCRLCAE